MNSYESFFSSFLLPISSLFSKRKIEQLAETNNDTTRNLQFSQTKQIKTMKVKSLSRTLSNKSNSTETSMISSDVKFEKQILIESLEKRQRVALVDEEICEVVDCSSNQTKSIPTNSSQDLTTENKKLKNEFNTSEAVKQESISSLPQTISKHSKILIVDNNSFYHRKILCRLFNSKGYDCEVVSFGSECLDKVSKQMILSHSFSYTAILIDQMLPLMDGFETTKELRNIGYKGVIIGVVALPDEKYKFVKAGANEAALQPLKLNVLHDRIQILNNELST